MPRLLVVEDEAHIATLLTAKFRNAGYAVEVATDGEAGLRLALASGPDVVLLDVMLPLMDGYEVCRGIRRHFDGGASGPCPVVIMLSARSQALDRQRGVEAGCDDYIVKPFRPAELLARVDELLAQRQVGDAR
jgi:two-component system alkaline phosphatase synthesis response regulator PhoP